MNFTAYLYVCMYVYVGLGLHEFMCTVYVQCPYRPEESVRGPEIGVKRQLWATVIAGK